MPSVLCRCLTRTMETLTISSLWLAGESSGEIISSLLMSGVTPSKVPETPCGLVLHVGIFSDGQKAGNGIGYLSIWMIGTNERKVLGVY